MGAVERRFERFLGNPNIENAKRFLRDYFLLSDDEYDMLFWYFWSLFMGLEEPDERFTMYALRSLTEGNPELAEEFFDLRTELEGEYEGNRD